MLLPSERHDDLRDGILLLCLSLRPLNGPLLYFVLTPSYVMIMSVHDESLSAWGEYLAFRCIT